MKKTTFKRAFAGIAAVFTIGIISQVSNADINVKIMSASAEEEWQSISGVEYKFDESTGTLKINDYSENLNINDETLDFKDIAASAKHLEIGNGWDIVSFTEFCAIETLTVGDDCTIGKCAFCDCTLLADEDIFRGCTELSKVTIGERCTIDEYAFCGSVSLKDVTIGSSSIIYENAFACCPEFTDVTIGRGCIVKEYAFEYSEQLADITIDDECSIECNAFEGCNNIQTVKFVGEDIDSVEVYGNNPEKICSKNQWSICTHTFDDNHKCTDCDYECKHSKFDADHKCILCGYECTHPSLNGNLECEFCGYFDEAAAKERLQENGEQTVSNDTASCFSKGSIPIIIVGAIIFIVCESITIIVLKKKKT